MGKASKWIRNFLMMMGKKEERENKEEKPTEYMVTPTASCPSTPKVRRRWSFKKSSSMERNNHKSARSFDLTSTHKLNTQGSMLEFDILEKHIKATLTAKEATEPKTYITRRVKDAAATKIQAVFRSYLARKALRALRSLVRLQALVRGHLVRKQTAAMVKRMHSLMVIQLRARVQRVQMSEEAHTPTRRSQKVSSENNQLTRVCSIENMDVSIQEKGRVQKKIGTKDKSPRMENRLSTFESHRLSVSRSNQVLQTCPSPSTLSDASTISYERHIEDFSFKMPKKDFEDCSNVSTTISSKTPLSITHSENPNSIISSAALALTYMSNTESSRSKARSHSEPRQRPNWSIKRKSKRTPSMDGITGIPDASREETPTHSRRHNVPESHEAWLLKLYKQAKPIKHVKG
ncbi:protein IQ-DOMAIN 19-like [Lycium ferocissimum]|uniref:protein IQ-DOMAIN 19-like n=1 Tax=Lycium ferocissimum TaxID=112874 RepID=UPI0028164DE8|nr:protein IQ-DOMAIN 19-like [Lycium ferocissimum]